MSLMVDGARKGTVALLHNAAASLPVPTLSAGGVIFTTLQGGVGVAVDTLRRAVELTGDLIFYPSASFSITGPVHLWARVSTTGATDTWVKKELIEATTLDLTQGPVGYRLRLSPWWDRVAIAAPSWVAGVGETVTIRMFRLMV